MPRLHFSTAPFFRHPLREAFRHVAAGGYSSLEVMVTQDPASQEPHLLLSLAEDHGVSIEVIHAPMLLFTRRVWGTDPVGKIYRAVQVAQEVGASIVVAHPPYRWQVRYQRWIETSLAELSARTGVTVAVENMFPVRVRERGLRFHAAQGQEDLAAYPHLVFDTSHAAVAGLDILEAAHRYRDNLVHVHASNNAGKGWDSHLPVYEGVLPMEEFLRTLRENGYAGDVSIELDLRPYFDDEDELQKVLAANREFCQEHLGLRAAGDRARATVRAAD
ncbi:MAG TPA: sugar phosphate isomerase/epimerase [Actinomycetota bacterium]|nr:sugar phosphate isomerase/epimerase [Actinomycetota bacterium]